MKNNSTKTGGAKYESSMCVSIISLAKHLGYEVNNQNKMLSVFKKETNPSMHLYEDTGRFKCFSIGKSGDVIDLFLASHNNSTKFTRETAVDEIQNLMKKGLVKSATMRSINQIKLWEDEKKTYQRVFKHYYEHLLVSEDEAEAYAFEYLKVRRSQIQKKIYRDFQNYCLKKPFTKFIKKYLTGEERKFSKKTIKESGIFYIHDVNTTVEYLKKNYTKEDLEKSGLFIGNSFVFKSHRLIFPYNEFSEIVYLTGRILPQKKKNIVSTPNSKILSKYKGLSNAAGNLSRQRFFNQKILLDLKKGDPLYILEGEPDCCIAIQWGLNAIGVPGVNNFPIHLLDKIKDFDLHFCFDSDSIAQEVVNKIISLLNKDVKNVELTNCKDLTVAYDKKYKSINDCPNIKIVTIHKKRSSLIKGSELVNHINDSVSESIVPGLLYIGYTIIAGFSKVGKSMLSLDLAVHIARGYKALGYFYPRDKYSVLYLGYEDHLTRINDRLEKMVAHTYHKKIPDNLYFMERKDLPLMDVNGIQFLEEKLNEYPDIKLIFIDTYAAATDDGDDSNPYNTKRDASQGRRIQQFALNRNIAVVVIHHLKKKMERYRINSITGTTGILAAADSIIMLEHINKNQFRLYIKARDIAENEYLVQAKRENHNWRIVGDSRFIGLPDNTIKVLSAFKNDSDIQLRSKEIASSINMKWSEVCRHVNELVSINLIKKIEGKKMYQLCHKIN